MTGLATLLQTLLKVCDFVLKSRPDSVMSVTMSDGMPRSLLYLEVHSLGLNAVAHAPEEPSLRIIHLGTEAISAIPDGAKTGWFIAQKGKSRWLVSL